MVSLEKRVDVSTENWLERFDIMTVTERLISVTFKSKDYEMVILEAENGKEKLNVSTCARNNLNRLTVKGLKPGRQYKLRLRAGKKVSSYKLARTLPMPKGKLMAKFAVVADVHYSVNKENKGGRLFVEIPLILTDIINGLNEENVDFVVLPGDITNCGCFKEYSGVKKLLDKLDARYYPVIGDHDTLSGKNKKLWRKYFGEEFGHFREKGINFMKLDTGTGVVPEKQLEWLAGKLRNEKKNAVAVLSHLQLFPDSYIIDKDKVIRNYGELIPLFEKYSERIKALYVGHKNVPSKSYFKKTMQLNCPQISQFPCGYLMVRIYENGWYHNFVNIRSEYLNECSRKDSNARKQKKWNCKYRYRDNHGYEEWNFVH